MSGTDKKLKVYDSDGKIIEGAELKLDSSKMYYFSSRRGGKTKVLKQDLPDSDKSDGLGVELTTSYVGSFPNKEEPKEWVAEDLGSAIEKTKTITVATGGALETTKDSIHNETAAVLLDSAQENDGQVPDRVIKMLPDALLKTVFIATVADIMESVINDHDGDFWYYEPFEDTKPAEPVKLLFSIQDLKFKHS